MGSYSAERTLLTWIDLDTNNITKKGLIDVSAELYSILSRQVENHVLL
jgi:hypothetical protein